MRPYMVLSDTPPLGYTSEDELLVSLTKNDVIEEYTEWEANLDKVPGARSYAWHNLGPGTQDNIFKAVLESGIDLDSIFDGVLL